MSVDVAIDTQFRNMQLEQGNPRIRIPRWHGARTLGRQLDRRWWMPREGDESDFDREAGIRDFPSDDGQRHELIDGVHVDAVAGDHSSADCDAAGRCLFARLNASGAGEVFAVPFDVVLMSTTSWSRTCWCAA
jgi:hypothetical protein